MNRIRDLLAIRLMTAASRIATKEYRDRLHRVIVEGLR